MKKLFNQWGVAALLIAAMGAIALAIFADLCGLWITVIMVAIATIIESCVIWDKEHPWTGLNIHILGCILFFSVMWLMALWSEPSDPNLAPWADPIERNFPFRDFRYEVEQLHGEFPITEVDAAYWWWLLVAIPAFRAIIVQPILLLAHRQNKKD